MICRSLSAALKKTHTVREKNSKATIRNVYGYWVPEKNMRETQLDVFNQSVFFLLILLLRVLRASPLPFVHLHRLFDLLLQLVLCLFGCIDPNANCHTASVHVRRQAYQDLNNVFFFSLCSELAIEWTKQTAIKCVLFLPEICSSILMAMAVWNSIGVNLECLCWSFLQISFHSTVIYCHSWKRFFFRLILRCEVVVVFFLSGGNFQAEKLIALNNDFLIFDCGERLITRRDRARE